jgi:sulfoxide reductase heme-binding subunit YedZ
MSIKRNRIRKRISRHHLPLLLFTIVAVTLVYWVIEAEDVIFLLSMATAYPGLALLAATLLTGPLKVIRKHPNPVSDDLTRDIGVWAAFVSLTHVVFGLQVHMRGRMWLLFLEENQSFPYIRFDLFGAANHTGLLALLFLVMLLATSNDWSLRALGTKKWKRLQCWNYGLFAIVLLHGVMYQVIENRNPPYIYIFSAMAAIVFIMQLMGFLHRKRQTT